jgi:glucose-1-phosphate thymidylyltransferase
MGIRDILFIVQKDDLSTFQNTFSSGEHVGLNFSYEIQEIQRGIADAYFIAENFLQKSPSVLALSDNVFLGKNYFDYANQALDKMKKRGGSVFGLPVPDPEKFGVIEFDVNEKIIGIEEKPSNPKSNLIIPGMYFFDSEAPLHAKTLKPSTRGELEITDLIQIYLQNNKLDLQKLDDSIVWHDTGNAEALLSASLKVKQYEIDHSLKLGSYEIAAYENNFIEINDLEKIADNFKKSDYGQSIRKYINNL